MVDVSCRFFLNSDPYRVHVCERCGLVCKANIKTGDFRCLSCNEKSKISQIFLPYACKLLFQELMTMCIVPRLFTTDEQIRKLDKQNKAH